MKKESYRHNLWKSITATLGILLLIGGFIALLVYSPPLGLFVLLVLLAET